jgi:hypothetical protein
LKGLVGKILTILAPGKEFIAGWLQLACLFVPIEKQTMKKLIICVFCLAALSSCDKFIDGINDRREVEHNNSAQIPAAVLSAFNAKYPNASRVEWEPEDGNTWKAKFFLGSVRWEAFFKADGSFLSANLK